MIFNPIVPKMGSQVSKKWVWNEVPDFSVLGLTTSGQSVRFEQSFTNNASARTQWYGINIVYLNSKYTMYYFSTETHDSVTAAYRDNAWDVSRVGDDRIMIFDEAPSGDLLTFLQANATPIVE